MNKKGLMPIAIFGIILMLGAAVAVAAEYNYGKSIVGMTTKEKKCSKLEQKFDKEYTKNKCDADNTTKKCMEIAKKFDKKFRGRCYIIDGKEVFLTGTASAEEDNGGNDKVESLDFNSYDFDELTGYNLKWTETSAGYEDYKGKSYAILYNTPKCTNQGCVILQGFDITDCTDCNNPPIVKGWTFEVYA